jgi:hypothetical protein
VADNLKLFISWSGEQSKNVASALRWWLPKLFDTVEPWMSDTDIGAGQRNMVAIERQLEDTDFGVLVVTRSNEHSPWLNYEAGAISKAIGSEREQLVTPILVDIDNPSQLTGPLKQFQAKRLDLNGVKDLVKAIAAAAGVDAANAVERAEVMYSQLERRIAQGHAGVSTAPSGSPRRDTDDMLDEVLNLVRALKVDSDFRALAEPSGRRETIARRVISAAVTDLNVEMVGMDVQDEHAMVFVSPTTHHEVIRDLEDRLSEQLPLQVEVAAIYPAAPERVGRSWRLDPRDYEA